jgi:hypothetical protein
LADQHTRGISLNNAPKRVTFFAVGDYQSVLNDVANLCQILSLPLAIWLLLSKKIFFLPHGIADAKR